MNPLLARGLVYLQNVSLCYDFYSKENDSFVFLNPVRSDLMGTSEFRNAKKHHDPIVLNVNQTIVGVPGMQNYFREAKLGFRSEMARVEEYLPLGEVGLDEEKEEVDELLKDLELTHIIYLDASFSPHKFFATISYNPGLREVIVAFIGTVEPEEWAQNAEVLCSN